MEGKRKKAYRGRLSVAVSVATLALIGGLIAWSVRPRVTVGIEVGDKAPDFSLARLDTGEPISLKQFRGHTVILLFWQSTCPDCRLAMPYFQELLERYHDRGLVILGINLDHDPNEARAYLEAKGYTLIPLWGSYEKAMEVVDLFRVPLVPHAILIDGRGIIRFRGTFPELPSEGEVERWLR